MVQLISAPARQSARVSDTSDSVRIIPVPRKLICPAFAGIELSCRPSYVGGMGNEFWYRVAVIGAGVVTVALVAALLFVK